MILFPAIDLKDGVCVRLVRGEMATATVFNDDPAGQARAFAGAGCGWLHVVDLNGAITGHSVNGAAVEAVVAAVSVPVQLGGGIRDLSAIENWLRRGVSRVVLGTVAVTHPEIAAEACYHFPGRIAIGIDARDGRVAVAGWTQTTEITAMGLARRAEGWGAAAIIHTDIARDGAMVGPNIEATVMIARAVNVPVIASGGFSSLDDLKTLKRVGGGVVEGAIVGRALYEGTIDLRAALDVMGPKTGGAGC